MKHSKLMYLGLVAATAAFTACSDSTTAVTTAGETDAQVNADVAAQSGDAIATDLTEMTASESFAGLPTPPAFDLFGSPGITINRTKVCYGGGAVQGACNANTTDSVQITVTMDGAFSRSNTTPHGNDSMSISLHRTRALTISGLAGTETTRIHNGSGADNDTTSFSGTADGNSRSRVMTLAANDSAQAIVFNVPRNTNPFPVSGKYIRNVTGQIVVTGGPNPGTRTFSRRIEVDFPADANTNVTLKVNDKTCTLNLTTRAVVNCST